MTQSEAVGAVLLALALVGLWVIGREVYAWFWKRAAAREQHGSSHRIGNVDLLESLERVRQLLLERLAGPEHVQSLDASCQALTAALKEATPGLAKIGDDAFLIARGARDIADQVAALRAVVFGGRDARDFPVTTGDDEGIRRANMEHEISSLMIDHNLNRRDAEARVRDLFARVSR